MPTPYSPIDESSYSEPTSFDPEAMLGHRASREFELGENGWRPASSGRSTVASQSQVQTVAEQTAAETTSAVSQSQPQSATNDTFRDIPLQGGTPEVASPGDSASDRFSAMASSMVSGMSRLKIVKFLGIVLFFFAAYAFVVCCSYFFTIDSDQSAILNGELNLDLYENAGRKFGALLAHTLIYNWLGLGAFILIFYLGACGLSLIGVYRPGFWGMTMRCLLTTVALSVIMGLVTYNIASPVYWGGLHGQLLNERLIAFTGIWGALAVSCIMGGMVALLYLAQLKKAIDIASDGLSACRTRRAEARARREAIRAERAEKARQAEETKRMAAPTIVEPAESAVAQETAKTPVNNESEVPEKAEDLFVSPHIPTSSVPEIETTVEEETGNSLFQEEVKQDDEEIDDEVDDETAENIEDAEDEPIELTPLFPPVGGGNPAALDPRDRPVYDPRAELSRFEFPSLELLNQVDERMSVDAQEMEENNARIRKTLSDYGIAISKIKATVGPTVTLYEIVPAEGVRISKIKNLEDDIALSLAALGIRIIAPIPGKGTIGIEVPNKDPQTVSMRSVLESEKFQNSKMDLPMAIGRTVSNEVYMADLTKMPHLLVAGATGMGKSVGLNAIIASLLYKKHPTELKFVMIDPKKVEFSLYAKLERHYLAKLPDEEDAIITNPAKVVATLNSLCVEMENRYALLKDAQMRNVKEYNDRFVHHALNPERGHRYLPYIVVIVDEFADLIITAGKEVETPIARIAQMARAVGIHMILATQRPSTNVITGVIKANFPGRIAFRVFQMVDSRTIIDRPGANQLIGRGDMLFSNNGKIDRVQCAFIDTPEVTAVCDFIDNQVGFENAYELPEYVPEGGDSVNVATLGDRDPLFDECARWAVSSGNASTSSLQRRFSIGYNRAGKIMDQMEAAGIVSPSQGIKGRELLVDTLQLERILENN